MNGVTNGTEGMLWDLNSALAVAVVIVAFIFFLFFDEG